MPFSDISMSQLTSSANKSNMSPAKIKMSPNKMLKMSRHQRLKEAMSSKNDSPVSNQSKGIKRGKMPVLKTTQAAMLREQKKQSSIKILP